MASFKYVPDKMHGFHNVCPECCGPSENLVLVRRITHRKLTSKKSHCISV